MKKLLALLMACATMTCAFASCGNDEADSSSTSSESSVSESSEEATETTTEEVTEEDTTEEESADNTSSDTPEDASEETTAEIERTTYKFIEDADKTAFLGKWECERLVVEGKESKDLMGIPLYAVYQLEIKDDGTAVMGESLNDISESEEDVSMTYEWGVVSDTEMAMINENGYYMLFTIDGDYLVGTEEGYDEQIYFKNVEDFTPFDYEAFMAEFQEGLEESEDGEWTTDEETDDTELADIDTVDEESVDDTADTEESVAE